MVLKRGTWPRQLLPRLLVIVLTRKHFLTRKCNITRYFLGNGWLLADRTIGLIDTFLFALPDSCGPPTTAVYLLPHNENLNLDTIYTAIMHQASSIESTSLYSLMRDEGVSHIVLSSPQQSPCLGTSRHTKGAPALIDPDLPVLNKERERLIALQAAINRKRKGSSTHTVVSPQITAVSKKSDAPGPLKPLSAPPRLVHSKAVPAFVPIRQPATKMTSFRGLVALRRAAQCIEQAQRRN